MLSLIISGPSYEMFCFKILSGLSWKIKKKPMWTMAPSSSNWTYHYRTQLGQWPELFGQVYLQWLTCSLNIDIWQHIQYHCLKGPSGLSWKMKKKVCGQWLHLLTGLIITGPSYEMFCSHNCLKISLGLRWKMKKKKLWTMAPSSNWTFIITGPN